MRAATRLTRRDRPLVAKRASGFIYKAKRIAPRVGGAVNICVSVYSKTNRRLRNISFRNDIVQVATRKLRNFLELLRLLRSCALERKRERDFISLKDYARQLYVFTTSTLLLRVYIVIYRVGDS